MTLLSRERLSPFGLTYVPVTCINAVMKSNMLWIASFRSPSPLGSILYKNSPSNPGQHFSVVLFVVKETAVLTFKSRHEFIRYWAAAFFHAQFGRAKTFNTWFTRREGCYSELNNQNTLKGNEQYYCGLFTVWEYIQYVSVYVRGSYTNQTIQIKS